MKGSFSHRNHFALSAPGGLGFTATHATPLLYMTGPAGTDVWFGFFAAAPVTVLTQNTTLPQAIGIDALNAVAVADV
jgi:hypothetical protein